VRWNVDTVESRRNGPQLSMRHDDNGDDVPFGGFDDKNIVQGIKRRKNPKVGVVRNFKPKVNNLKLLYLQQSKSDHHEIWRDT